jgi:hypothetical protein
MARPSELDEVSPLEPVPPRPGASPHLEDAEGVGLLVVTASAQADRLDVPPARTELVDVVGFLARCQRQ